MDRRLFVDIFKALDASSVLAEWELAEAKQSLKTTMALPSSVKPVHAIEHTDSAQAFPRIGVIAIGVISRSILGDLASQLHELCRTIAINTDAASLRQVQAHRKIHVGHSPLPSHDSQLARFHALSAVPEIADAVAGLDIVLLVAGMGGGAGTGISPVVAQAVGAEHPDTLFCDLPFYL